MTADRQQSLSAHVDCSLLFVYGTLRRRFARHSLLQAVGARYVGRGSVQGELFDLGDFPGAVKPRDAAPPLEACSPGSSGVHFLKAPREGGRAQPRVVGEVFRLPSPERTFKTLDAYEGASKDLYTRELAEVTLQRGERVTAWVYWLNRLPAGMRRILSGDYAAKRKTQDRD